jgi:uncharacterized repeat protein (TIGR03803 family)
LRVLARLRVFIYCATLASLISGCAASAVPSDSVAATAYREVPAAHTGHYRVLYAFHSPGGTNPAAGLVQYKGFLYGVTTNGGGAKDGVLYRLSITGKVTVLHVFSRTDGANPYGELLPFDGKLYGTTMLGGATNLGEVFVSTTGGKLRSLHSFSGYDGGSPQAGLIQVDRTLYGTTESGGAHNDGTVFAVDVAGHFRVVYNFGSRSADGADPGCRLVFWKNKLYGTTEAGGQYGGGTAFSVTPSGKETLLYNLGGGSDGVDAGQSTLTPWNGKLYGTTEMGGTHAHGVVFVVDPSGAGRTLYNFGDGSTDGYLQMAGVIAYRGALYGTSSHGSAGNQGAIFRVTAAGKEAVLHAFSGIDGAAPYSRLLPEGSNVYGTVFDGGAYSEGSAFRFTL